MAEGSYQELQATGLDFTKLLESSQETEIMSENECSSKDAIPSDFKQRLTMNRQMSVQSIASSIGDTKFNEIQENPVQVAESRSSGNVSQIVYSSYFSAGGSCCTILFFILMCVATQILTSGSDYWITFW